MTRNGDQNQKNILEIFNGLWDKQQVTWLVSVIDPVGYRKTDLFSWLVAKHLQGVGCAKLSLDLYGNNFLGLFSAILSSPSIRTRLDKAGAYNGFQVQKSDVLQNLNRRPLSIASNEIGAALTADTLTLSTNVPSADADKFIQSTKQMSEAYAGIQIADIWLSTISVLRNEPKLVVLFDDYDLFVNGTDLQAQKIFLDVLYEAHCQVDGLRVFLGSRKPLRLPPSWIRSSVAIACKI